MDDEEKSDFNKTARPVLGSSFSSEIESMAFKVKCVDNRPAGFITDQL